MTTQELEEALLREKEKAEKALGCDMCKKYARCLYCFSKDEYRCAKAHERLMLALERGVRKFPAYLLHEPPVEVLETSAQSVQPVRKAEVKPAPKPMETATPKPAETAAPKPAETAAPKPEAVKQPVKAEEESGKELKEEMVETIAHILSGYDMDTLPEERTQELMKISAILASTEEETPARADRTEQGENILARTKRSEGDVPLFVIRRRK